MYIPTLGSEIAVPGREREQGHFRESTEGAASEHGGALREHRGSRGRAGRRGQGNAGA